jgi:hypothetical protein
MNVSYIVKTKKDKFRPFVGTPIESLGDNDSFINVIASGELMLELSEAQKFIQDNSQGIDKIYLNPVPSGMMGTTWLSELVDANR